MTDTTRPAWYKTYTDERGLHWLFFRRFDVEEDEYGLHQQVEIGDVVIDLTLSGFSEKVYGTVIEDLNAEEHANVCFKQLLRMGAVDENGNEILTNRPAA